MAEEGGWMTTIIALILALAVLAVAFYALWYFGYLPKTILQIGSSGNTTPTTIIPYTSSGGGLLNLNINGNPSKFWFSETEYLVDRYKDKKNTPLYLENDKAKVAKSYVDASGQIIVDGEESEFPGTYKQFSIISFDQMEGTAEFICYKYKDKLGEGEEVSERISAVAAYKEIFGAELAGKELRYVYLKKINGNVYIKFTTAGIAFGYRAAHTDYILVDYWNVYRKFTDVPDWAKLS